MPQDLRSRLHQLTFLQINHEARCSKGPDGLQGILQNLLPGVPIYRYVVKVNHHCQWAVTRLPPKHIFNYILEVGRGLRQAHRHPQPPVFTAMRHEGGVVAGLPLKEDVVKSCFEVDHAYPLRSP